MVALCHCLLVLTVDGLNNIWFTSFSEAAGIQSAITRFLLLFLNGGAAVTVFFVLSGYVLGLSLDKHSVTFGRTIAFYFKRIFRLYPAHIVTMAGIVISICFFHDYMLFEAGSGWYAEWYRFDLDASTIVNNLTLKENYLNHIAWSLQVEIAGSLFLPFAYLLSRKTGIVVNLAILGLLVALSAKVSNLYLFFLYVFYAGLMLPLIYKALKDSLAGSSGTVLLLFGTAMVCGARTIVGLGNMFGFILIETFGSVLIIGYLLNPENSGSWFNRFLARDVINRLGRYSYSFYLLHFIILYWIAYLLFHVVSADILSSVPLLFGVGMAAVSIPVTFWLSGKMYHHVEVPMMRLGKRLVGD